MPPVQLPISLDIDESLTDFSDLNVALEEVRRRANDIDMSFSEAFDADLQRRLEDISEFAISDLSAGLAEVIVYGEDLGDVLEDSLKRVAAAVLEAIIQFEILGPLIKDIRDGGKFDGGGIVSTIGSFLGFGGGRATGGPVQRGMVYEVGEQGRELFVPRVNGDIISNQNLRRMVGGAGGQSLTVNVDARGATDPAMVEAAARRAVYEAAPAIIRMSAKTTMDGFSRPTLQGGWG